MMRFCSTLPRAGALASAPFTPWNLACVNSQKTLPFPALSPEAICLSEHGAPGAPTAMPECQKNTANFQTLFLGDSQQKCNHEEPGTCAFSHGNVGQCLTQNVSMWESEEARFSDSAGSLPSYPAPRLTRSNSVLPK